MGRVEQTQESPPAGAVDPYEEWREAVERWLRGLDSQGTGLHRSFDGLADRVARLERHDQVRTMTDWIEHATLRTAPLVSVVMATRDRSEFFDRSIGSLLAQHYGRWELVVMDDGGVDHAEARIAAFGDPRLRYTKIDPSGPGGARNRALTLARGEVIAYLDDDNLMHPLWLKAVVWAFEQRPDVNVVYGGIVIDDTARLHREPGAQLPSLWLEPFDRERVAASNVADMGAIAHRSGLASAVFDEELRHAGDWDLLLSLTAEEDPLVLPVVALHYYCDAPRRLSDGSSRDAEFDRIRAKHTGARSGGR